MSSLHNNLREFIAALKRHNQVQEIDVEVDPHLELAEIHRRVIENEGPVLFFRKLKGVSSLLSQIYLAPEQGSIWL